MGQKGIKYGKYAWKPKCCKVCGKIFQTTGPHQNYCSLQCRFEDFPVDKTSSPSGCWLWLGSKNPKGYGQGAWGTKMRPAHQLSWECFHGPRLAGLCVCHSCHNKACVNPSHLYLGTNQKNVDDSRILSQYAKALTPQKVRSIKKLFREGISRRKIAKLFNVSHASIDKIANNKTWTHIS